MNTNFEVWRDQLTPESIWEKEVPEFRGSCAFCPAKKFCDNNPNMKCADAFFTWADSPAEGQRNDKA